MSKVPEVPDAGRNGVPRNGGRYYSAKSEVNGQSSPTISGVPSHARTHTPVAELPGWPRGVDGGGRWSEHVGAQDKLRVTLIEVPAPDPDAPPTREIPQAGNPEGNYRTLSGPSSWRGVKTVGPTGEVNITYIMTANVAPHVGVSTSPMTDADQAVVDEYTHHVSVIPVRTVPAQPRDSSFSQRGQEVPHAPSKDGVAADFLYYARPTAGMAIEVRTDIADQREQERALVAATAKIGFADTFKNATTKKEAEEAEALRIAVTQSQRDRATVTATTIVISGKNREDAIAGAQAFIAGANHGDYPFAFELGLYTDDLEAAHAYTPPDQSSRDTRLHTAAENAALTRLPTEKEHPGTPRIYDIGVSPNSPEIPAGIPKIPLGINIKSGQPHEYPYMDTHLVVAGASGWGKTNLLVDAAGSTIEANDSAVVREAAEGRGIRTSAFFFSMAQTKEAPTQLLADRVHAISGHENDKVVDIQLGGTGGEKYPYGIDMMEVPEGYPVSRWMNDFVDMSILGWAADHKSRNPGEDTDASERALRDRWREVLDGSEESGDRGLMWKKGWDVELDRSRYKAGRPAALNMAETVAAMMQAVMAQTITGSLDADSLGQHTRDYADWMKRNATPTSTGQTGRLLHAKEQKLNTRGMLERGMHGSFSFNGVAQPAFVAAAYMTRLLQDQWVLNHQSGNTGPIIRQDWSIDEAGVVLNSTIGEKFITDLSARGRSEGMGREQGGVTMRLGVHSLGDLPDSIGINAQAVVIGATPAGPIQARIAEEFGLSSAARDRLRSLPPGQAFVKSPFQNSVNMITTHNLETVTRGVGHIADIQDLLVVGDAFAGHVSNEVRVPAKEFLSDPRGVMYQFHTNLSVAVYLTGGGYTEPAEDLRRNLNVYLDERMRDLRVLDAIKRVLRDATHDEKIQLRREIHDDIVRLSISRAVSAATTELLKSGKNPQLVARRIASWMPAVMRGDEINENFNFVGTGESFFDAVTHDGTFNPIRARVEAQAVSLSLPSLHGINLEAENGITQLRTITEAITKEVAERYHNFRSELTQIQNQGGPSAPRITDYDQSLRRQIGDIPGITVSDSDGRKGTTVEEQRKYLNDWEKRVGEDPSLLGGDKWIWVAEQKKLLEEHIKTAPPIPAKERGQWEVLYNEVVNGISFEAPSAEVQLRVIDNLEEAWRLRLQAQGEYRSTDLAEIIAPGTTGRTLLDTAVIAVAEAQYPTWSGHRPFNRQAYTTAAYLQRQMERALTQRIQELVDSSIPHPLIRVSVARALSRIIREMIENRDERSSQ